MANNLRFLPNTHALPRADASRALLLGAAGSAKPLESPLDAARKNLGRLDAGLAKEIAIAGVLKTRIPPIRLPSPAPTLQELVERARTMLQTAENDARSAELEGVRTLATSLATRLRGDV